jgi:glucokinase
MTTKQDSDPHAVLGLDLGGTSVKWVVMDADNGNSADNGDDSGTGGRYAVQASGRVPTPRTGDIDDVLAALAGIARQAPAASRVALAAAAVVDAVAGSLLVVPNIPGDWAGRMIRSELADAIGQPVALVNDARAFAWGQLCIGAAAGASDVVFVTLGTGVGGAVASGGELRLGHLERGGELGHIPVDPEGGRRCGCGARGCLETLAGGKAIAAMGADAMRTGTAPTLAKITGGRPDRVSAGDVFAAAERDPACAAIVTGAGRALGRVLAGLASTLAPEVVVVGGGLSAGLAKLMPFIDEAFAEQARLVMAPKVLPADFADLAGAVGAAAWAHRPPAGHEAVSLPTQPPATR